MARVSASYLAGLDAILTAPSRWAVLKRHVRNQAERGLFSIRTRTHCNTQGQCKHKDTANTRTMQTTILGVY